MEWKDLAGSLIRAGAPIIGSALGGPLGGMVATSVGEIVAQALGVEATPEAVNRAIESAPPSQLAAKLSAADAEVQAKWPALADMVKAEADLGKSQVGAMGETMRTELQLASLLTGRARSIVGVMQAVWRPYIMLVWGTTLPFQLGAVLHRAYAKDAASLAELGSLLYALAAFNTGPAALAGVYAWGRTKEKIADLVPLPGAVKAAFGKVIK
jgi:hypothetical protein